MGKIQSLGKVARYRLKCFVSTRPRLYFPFMYHFGQSTHRLTTPETELCIEGAPRSANSFAVSAFQSSQPAEVSVAHHTHVAANLMQACALGAPAVLLIRSPRATVISCQALALETRAEAGEEYPSAPIPLVEYLRSWLAFYRAMRPYTDWCVIALFPQVIEDFGIVIRQVNEQFGRDFGVFEHTDANVERIREGKGYHALPGKRREAIKARVRRDFERMLKASRARRLLADAQRLYDGYEQKAAWSLAE